MGDVHTSHCCARCGCKYGDDDCCVATGVAKQEYPCEDCETEIQKETELRTEGAKAERERIVAAGRAWVTSKADSAFSTAHLANFLDAIENHEPKESGDG